MKMIRTTLAALLAFAFSVSAEELPEYPAALGAPALILDGGVKPSAPGALAYKLLANTPESNIAQKDDHISLRRKGYADSGMTLSYRLPDDFPGGAFTAHVLLSTGGHGDFVLNIEQCNTLGEKQLASNLRVKNKTSWKVEYLTATGSVLLRPGLPELRVSLSGKSSEAKNLFRIVLVPEKAGKSDEPPVPEAFSGKEIISLEGGILGHVLPGARQLHGALAGQTPETTARQNRDSAMSSRKGYTEFGMTLRYDLPGDFSGGTFDMAVLCSTGGIATWNFVFKQFDPQGTLLAEEKRSVRNKTSWKTEYLFCETPLTLVPGAGKLEVSISGKSGDAKNLFRILLAPRAKGAQLTPPQTELRQKLLAFDRTGAKKKLILLEGADPAAGDLLFAPLLKCFAGEKLDSEYRTGEEAETLRAALNLPRLPAVLLTDAPGIMLALFDVPGEMKGRLPEYRKEVPELFTPGEAVMTAGVWAGPAGISLLGLGSEELLSPGIGDAVPVMRFDARIPEKWRTQRPVPGGKFVLEEQSTGFVWSRGSAYAFCYLVNEKPAKLLLTLEQSGSESAAWLDGMKLVPQSARRISKGKGGAQGVTDQGNVFEVQQEKASSVTTFALNLAPGSHRLLLKLIMEQAKGETFDFSLRFEGDSANVRAALADPAGDTARHRALNRLASSVRVNAPANLPRPGDALKITTRLRLPIDGREWPLPPAPGALRIPLVPFEAELRQDILDYDGKSIRAFRAPVLVPGEYAFDFGPAPEYGYYTVHTRIFDRSGRMIGALPPDGFSVIGDPAARRSRLKDLKMMTSFYWLDSANAEGITDWMARVGAFHNVGSGNGFNPTVRDAFAARNLTLTADFIDTWSSASKQSRYALAEKWSHFTNRFKAYNEIDIHKEARPTPEKWVARTREEYEAVKAANPGAEFTGGSLVRVATDKWFEECLKLGLDQWVDRWDVHAYPKIAPRIGHPYMSNSRNEDAQGVELVYERIGRKNPHPFIMGETGARCSHGRDARRWQAETMPKMLAWALSRPEYSGIAFLVPWVKATLGEDIPIAHYPAEAALHVAGVLIDGFTPENRTDCPPHVDLARFGATWMGWSTGKPETVRLAFPPGTELTKVDVVGRRTPLATDEEGGVRLELTASPVYVLPTSELKRLFSE